MLVLFFEVTPHTDAVQEYLELAAKLKPELEASGGCLFLDRFRSLSREGSLLSYQLWRDEAALTKWRVNSQHHKVQTVGRTRVFEDYRLRVGQVVRSEVPGQSVWQPERLNFYNDPAVRPPRYVAIVESQQDKVVAGAATKTESFASIYHADEYAHLLELPDLEAGVALCEANRGARIRVTEIERDYSKFDRAEAPQFFASLKRKS